MCTTFSGALGSGERPRVIVSTFDPADTAPTVVALHGALDTAALIELAGTFKDALAQDESDVVIDLAGVNFMGAAWIGALVRSRAALAAQDRALTLRAPSPFVHGLLELCDLSHLVGERRPAPRGRSVR